MADVGIKITASDQTGSAFNSVAAKLGAVKQEAAGLGDTVGGLVGKFSALGIALDAGLSVAAVKNAIDTADAFSKMAQKTGVAVEQLRELNYAASLSDVSTEALGTGLRKLSVAMAGAAGGNKEQVAVFKALGVNVKDASGSLKGADAVLTEVAAKFASFKDGPEKAALAVQVFGKSGAELIPLLNAGASGLSDMAQEARDLGAVFSGDMAKQAEAFNDNLTRIGVASQGAFYSIANELLPTLNALSNAFVEANKTSSGFASAFGSGIDSVLKATAISIAYVSTGLQAMGREIGGLVAKFSAMGEAGGVFTKAGRAAWGSVNDSIKQDHEKARRELQAFQSTLYQSDTRASDVAYARRQGFGETTSGIKTTAPIVSAAATTAAKTISEAAKGLALYNDLMDQASGFEKTWAEDVNKLRAALDGKTISQTQFNTAVQALLAKQPRMVAAAQAEADWQKEAAKAYEDAYTAQAKAATTADEALQKQLEHNAAIGLSVTALSDLEAAKLTDLALSKDSLAATADMIDFSGQLGDKYREEARALRDLASAKISGAQKQASVDAAKESKAEWDKYADQIGQSLTDQIMEGGRNGADYLRNLFRTMVLRPVIQGVVGAGVTAVAGSATAGALGFGGSAAGAAAGASMSGGITSLLGSSSMGALDIMGFDPTTLAIGAAILVLSQMGGKFVSASDSGRASIDYTAAGIGGAAYNTTGDAAQIAAATANTNALAKTYFDTASALGVKAMQAAFEVGTNTGREGAAPQTVLGVNIGKVGYSSGEIASTDAAGLSLAASRAVLTALQASEMPSYLAGVFDGITAGAATQEQITTALTGAAALKTFHDQLLALPFARVADLSYEATQGLIAAAGGLDKLQANLGTYYSNFYTAEEQRAQTIANINKATFGSGLDAATATRDSFRAIVEAQDLSTESGQKMYAALIYVSGAFAGLTPVVADATQVLEDAAKTAKAAADSAASALQTVATQYQSFVSAAASSKSAVDSAKDAITQGYLSAQEAVASAQAEIASVSAQAGQALLGFAQNIRTFIAGLDQSAAGGFGLKDRFAASQADFAIAVAQARSGDKDAMSKVVSLAGSMLSLGQEQTASAADYRLLVAQTKGTLDGLATSTESANAAAKAADPMVAAQAKLLAAQKELNAWSKAASESGASTDRQITDYAADWRTANTAYQQALADLATADDLTQGLDLALGTPLQNIANALEALGISMAQKALTQSPSSAAKTAADAALKATGSKVTEAWVNTSVGDVWASTGGATGVKDASGLDAMVYGKNGFSGTVSAIQSSILDWWNNTPNASALTLYQKAIETGISASTLDAIMGWPKGKSNEWAVTNGLPKFAAGGDHSGGWALVGEQGPELAYMPPAHIYPAGKTGSMLGGNTERLERLVDGLTAEVKRLQAIVRDGNDNTRQLADQFDNVTEGGNATRTVSV